MTQKFILTLKDLSQNDFQKKIVLKETLTSSYRSAKDQEFVLVIKIIIIILLCVKNNLSNNLVFLAKRIALMQGKLALVTLLSNFKFSLCEKTPIPLAYSNRTFLNVSDQMLYLRVTKR